MEPSTSNGIRPSQIPLPADGTELPSAMEPMPTPVGFIAPTEEAMAVMPEWSWSCWNTNFERIGHAVRYPTRSSAWSDAVDFAAQHPDVLCCGVGVGDDADDIAVRERGEWRSGNDPGVQPIIMALALYQQISSAVRSELQSFLTRNQQASVLHLRCKHGDRQRAQIDLS